MADIVIAEFMDEAAVEDLRRDYDVVYDPGLVDRADDLLAAVAGCRALVVRNRTQVRGALLDAAPRLVALGRLGVGLDNIDIAACQARGIAVLPATGANDLAVAEYVIAGLLMLLRGTYHASARVLAGEWPRMDLMGREIAGRRQFLQPGQPVGQLDQPVGPQFGQHAGAKMPAEPRQIPGIQHRLFRLGAFPFEHAGLRWHLREPCTRGLNRCSAWSFSGRFHAATFAACAPPAGA